jgi:hypothetical protein
MKNLNEELNRFRELLNAQHGVIKPLGLFTEQQAPKTTGDTSAQKTKFYQEHVPPPLPADDGSKTAMSYETPLATPAPPTQQTVGTGPVPPPQPTPFIPAPPSTGSTAPQPAQPTESEFYEEEDFDDFEDDNEDEMWEIDQMLQDAIEEGRDILEFESDMTNDSLNELSELDIAEELRELGYDDLADSIEEMYDIVFNK